MAGGTLQNLFLLFGIVAPLIYISTDLIAGILLKGYNFVMQSASELPSIESPVSSFVLPLHFAYYLLMIAFGLGVWQLGAGSRMLDVLAAFMIGNAVVSLVSDAFFRANYSTDVTASSNVVSVILGATGVIFFLVAIIFGAVVFTNWFRFYSIGTLLVFLLLGILGLMSSPHIGIQERVMIYGYASWVIFLSLNFKI
jgi:Protein of unknown function (DUF998)